MPTDKIGMVFLALPAQLDKIGMPPPDHADAQLDLTGMELPALAVTEEENGTLFQSHASAHPATGMVSHASSALPVKHGIQTLFHVHAQPTHTGMVLTAEPAQARTDTGTINLTTAFAEPATGTALLALFAPPTPTGMVKLALLATEEEFGTH